VIAGIVLAAGAGTRFGSSGSKLLAEFRGRPLVEHAVGVLNAVPELDRVVVVLGSRADEVRAAVDFGRAEPVVCADWEAGQSASLRCGLAVVPEAERVIVTLGDEPTLAPAVVVRFVAAPGGARAVYDGRPGHPVVLGREQLAAVRALRGDAGARSLLEGGPRIECSDLCRPHDVDTLQDLEAIRREARAVV
jgi:CTP:molybdopterin cytidylyltransferase MocA